MDTDKAILDDCKQELSQFFSHGSFDDDIILNWNKPCPLGVQIFALLQQVFVCCARQFGKLKNILQTANDHNSVQYAVENYELTFSQLLMGARTNSDVEDAREFLEKRLTAVWYLISVQMKEMQRFEPFFYATYGPVSDSFVKLQRGQFRQLIEQLIATSIVVTDIDPVIVVNSNIKLKLRLCLPVESVIAAEICPYLFESRSLNDPSNTEPSVQDFGHIDEDFENKFLTPSAFTYPLRTTSQHNPMAETTHRNTDTDHLQNVRGFESVNGHFECELDNLVLSGAPPSVGATLCNFGLTVAVGTRDPKLSLLFFTKIGVPVTVTKRSLDKTSACVSGQTILVNERGKPPNGSDRGVLN